MITITCEKCKKVSDNPCFFNDNRFTFTNYNGQLKSIHLCYECQSKMRDVLKKAREEFLNFEILGWQEYKGLY